MIHIFHPSDTDFTSNGERPIALLKALEKKDKDTWEVDVSASLDYFEVFKQDYILQLPTKYGYQPFRIDNPETLGNSIYSIAKHIAYDLKNHVVTLATPIEMNCSEAMGEVLSHSYPLCSFNVYSDITTEKTFSIINMSLWDAMIQLSKEYNGHLDFDGFQIRITAEQGADRGVNIEYGSTLQGAKVKENWDLVVTELYPVTTSGITIGWLYSDVVYDRPYARRVEFDVETEEQLTFQANLYLSRYKVPRINYEVSSSLIQNVFLGDTIQVVARQFSIFTEVISYEFNVLTQKIIKLEFGNFRNTLRTFFGGLRGDIEEATLKKAQVKVDEVKGQILLKADQEDLNVVDNKVTNLSGTFDVTAQQIRSEVAETYSTKSALDEYKSSVLTQFTQTATDYTYLFQQLDTYINTLEGDTQARFIEIVKYIRFVDGKIVLGEVGNEITLEIDNDRISFLQNGAEVAYISNNTLYITDGRFLTSLRIGNFAFIPRSNGSLDFKKVS